MDSFCFLPFQYAICPPPPLQTTWNCNSGMIIIQMHVTKMICEVLVRQLGTRIAYRYSCSEGRLHQAATNRKQIYIGRDNANLHTWILVPTYIISGESKVSAVINMKTALFVDITSQYCIQARIWRKPLHPSSFNTDNGGRRHLRNVDTSLPNYKS
jgi:hypothetical protein